MQLYVRTVLGNTWRLRNLEADTTVEILKLLVYRQTGMYPAEQRLLRGTRELRDEETLAALGLRDGETLHLHPRMRTGF